MAMRVVYKTLGLDNSDWPLQCRAAAHVVRTMSSLSMSSTMPFGPNHVRQGSTADDSQNAPATPVRLDTPRSPRVVEHLTAGQLVSET